VTKMIEQLLNLQMYHRIPKEMGSNPFDFKY
jgi:hypothetical protein